MSWANRMHKLSGFFAELSGWLIVPMMLTIFLDAVLRGLFGVAVAGVIELNSLLLVAMVYMGLAGAQSRAINFRVTLLSDRLGGHLKFIITLIGYVLFLCTLTILFLFCINSAIFSYTRSEVSYGLIQFPLWPSRIIICIGLLLLFIQYLFDGMSFILKGIDPFDDRLRN